MKKIFVILLFLGHFASAGVLLETANELASKADDLDGTVFTMFKVSSKEYIKQARAGKDAVCNSDAGFSALSAQNVWTEIQSAVRIQKYTTQKYIETCSTPSASNEEFCSQNNTELLGLYRDIQACVHGRVEERMSVLAQKMNRSSVFSCISVSPYQSEVSHKILREDSYFTNPNFATIPFSEVAAYGERDLSTCKMGGEEYDLKYILVYSAINKCMGKLSAEYESCLKKKCPDEKTTCRTYNRDDCYDFALTREREYIVENINKCMTEEMLSPSDANVAKTKKQCSKGKENSFKQFDETIKKIGFGIGSKQCFRSKKCKSAIEKSFQLEDAPEVCEITAQTKSTTRNQGNK